MRSAWRLVVAAAVFALAAPAAVHAQYFGRNKVQYESFKFQIFKTEHFDLYYYPDETEAAKLATRLAERWYSRLSRFFNHDLHGRQVIILYASPAQFRQTNAVEELIGEGTGGLTEAMKRRIVLPMAGSIAETDHVIGHELVHAFQYDITGADPVAGTIEAPEILAYPLWWSEGMAEYITLGAVDPQTSMWLRDAAIHEELPSIRDLDKITYFPYRWGHAFWAFIGAKYGDRAIGSLLRAGANPRDDLAGLALQLGTDPDKLTAEWHAAIRKSTDAIVADAPPLTSDPRVLVSRDTGGGRYNVGPRLSPDGKRLAYFSENGRFAVDLYVADVESGKILHRLSSMQANPHFDSLAFLSSAGAWSPDSQTLAIGAVRQAKPVIALLDPDSGDVRKELPLPGLSDVLNPSYAPDGKSIVFSGNRGGLMDLYRITLATGEVEQLTFDPFADLEPVISNDGTFVVFVTERYSMSLDTLEPGPLRLARLDLATKEERLLSGFLGGRHLSPQFSKDGQTLTFIAEPDGVANLYRMPVDGGPVMRITSFLTGVAGITASSPALSEAGDGRLAFSVFEHDSHAIFILDEQDIRQTVAPAASRRAALLPGRETPTGEIQTLIGDTARGLPPASSTPPSEEYKPKLKLDFISQPTFAVGITNFGAYVAGQVSASFSDMLGDRSLGMAVFAAGTVQDLGGQLVYVNRRRRWNWAAKAEIVPYMNGILGSAQTNGTTITLTEVLEREISRGFSGTALYPLNPATRIEVGAAARQLTFQHETRVSVYDAFTGDLIDRERNVTTIGKPLYVAEPMVAIVRDNTLFGLTSPIYGHRTRVEVSQSLIDLRYTTLLVDYRQYFMPKKPITIAVRAVHFGRYGLDGENKLLRDLYAGYPELVHGYYLGSVNVSDCVNTPNVTTDCTVYNNLSGSRLFVGNVEVRAPLLGLIRGDMSYGKVPIEVAGFFDAGVTWSGGNRPALAGGDRPLMRSVGAAARANIFGFLMVELSAAHPFDRPGTGIQWQFTFRQGF